MQRASRALARALAIAPARTKLKEPRSVTGP
jgi:hypothetical protein